MATPTPEQQELNAINNGKTFIWHEVYSPSSQAAVDFYTGALDFGTAEMDMGEGRGIYKMLTRNGIPVAGVMGTAEMPGMDQVPAHWATYISVDDVDARLEKCIEMGATKVMGPIEMEGVGRFVLIADPSGAHVWLFKG